MTGNTRILLVLLALQIALGVSYAILTPLWQDHEPDYYNVARFIATERRFPTPADYPEGDAEIRQATQPPLYFLIAAPVVALFDNQQPVPYGVQPVPLCPGVDPASAVVTLYPTNQAYDDPFRGTLAAAYFLRFLNVLFGAAAVVFTYKAGQTLFPKRPVIALAGAAILALEPASLLFVPEISNDSLLLAVCAAQLWLSARVLVERRVAWRTVLLLVVISAAAPLVKLPGWAALAVGFLVLAYRLIFHARGRRALWLGVGLIVGLTAVIAIFNDQQYGNVFGRYSVLATLFSSLQQTANIPPVVIAAVIDQTHVGLIAPLMALHPRAAFVSLYNLLLVVCLIGCLIGVGSAVISRAWGQARAYGLLVIAIAVAVAVVMLRNALTADASNTTTYNQAMIFAPIRYYVPALPALALLIAAGLGSILPRFSRGQLAALPALSFGLVSAGTVLLLLVSRPPDAVIDPQALASTPGFQSVSLRAADDAPEIVGYRLNEQAAAGWIDLTLYLKLNAPTETNFVARTELSKGQNTSLCEFLPARGAYPTPRWSPGQIVVTQASIPNCQANFPVDTRLTLSWIGYSRQGDVLETTAPVTLAQLDQPLATAAACPPNLGVIDGKFQLVKWNSPETVDTGVVYLPSVNWLVLDESAAALTRVFRLTYAETGQVYTCAGSPSEAQMPVQSWARGTTAYFDQCQMQFPADAPAGRYIVGVGMETADGRLLPAVQPDGTPGEWLSAGEVEVKPHG